MPVSIATSHQVETMSGPSFENPPAVERVLSVQFRELGGFDLVHYGMWFEQIRDIFPLSTRQTRLPQIVERFPAAPSQPNRLEFEIGPSLSRCVFSSTDPSTRLMQLQPDRFAMNWRRDLGDEYRPFSDTSQRFEDSFRQFEQFCANVELSEPIVELCEVTYVNRILVPDDENPSDFFAQVFGEGTLGLSASWLGPLSALSLNRRFDFAEEHGRLYAEAASVEDSNGHAFLLKMVGRTVVRDGDQWLDRLQLAHDWVVNGFVAITGESVRKNIWGQIT